MQRPAKDCDATEIRVAEKLRSLEKSPHRWTIIWGYYYRDDKGMDREGDFLIIGPAGGVLVMEVKSTMPRHFSQTGMWEGEERNPIEQLQKEWQGVIRGIKEYGRPPFVAKVLCVPGEQAAVDCARYQGVERKCLVLGNDLDAWVATWIRLFGNRVENGVTREEWEAVIKAFGQGSLPVERQSFVDYTEEWFQRQFTAQFQVLDQLGANRQLLIRGGTGTGKTWHALEYAFRKASEDASILFVTYHKALTGRLRKIVEMRQLEKGKVVVMGWEELWFDLCRLAGVEIEVPNDARAWNRFYDEELPLKVLELSKDGKSTAAWPVFDGLVVDEGQDHDTSWPTQGEVNEQGGWWQIYQRLLKDGSSSVAGIFYDPAQRPAFRRTGGFDAGVLEQIWSQPAHVHLQAAVRYTRPIWLYLSQYRHAVTSEMIDSLGNGDHLPEGPEVMEVELTAEKDTRMAVEEVLKSWLKDGWCQPEEVLILHASSTIDSSPLAGCEQLLDRSLKEFSEEEFEESTIRHTSIFKSKGLDAKGVILIGLAKFEQLTRDSERYAWFMAASRARQLLAVVS